MRERLLLLTNVNVSENELAQLASGNRFNFVFVLIYGSI